MLQSILSLIANKDKLQCMADFLGVTPEKFFVSGRSCCIQKRFLSDDSRVPNDWLRSSTKEERDENKSIGWHMGSAPLGSVSYDSNKVVIFRP